MRISGVNDINCATNMQSKSSKKPAFGMNYSEGVKKLFAEYANELSLATLGEVERLNRRNDNFVLEKITNAVNGAKGLKGVVVLSKEGKTFELDFLTAGVNPSKPKLISYALEYISNLPLISSGFKAQVAKDEYAAEVAKHKVVVDAGRKSILGVLK